MLSKLSNALQMSTIKDAVTDMYHTMYHKLNKVKDVLSKDPEILPTKEAPIKDEGYVSPTLASTPVSTSTPKDDVTRTSVSVGDIMIAAFTNIFNYIWDYGLKLALIIFYIALASLVANDMIIYAAPIRAFFFIFTLFFSVTLLPCAIIIAFYYLLLKGYDYYNYNLSSVKPKPSRCFPMIFAILPLTTYYSESPFIRFFLWAFMYQKSPDDDERMRTENERLSTIMKNYWNELNGSFEYIAKIEKTPPFSTLYNNIREKLTIKGMHPIQLPDYHETVATVATVASNATATATATGNATVTSNATATGNAATATGNAAITGNATDLNNKREE
jgi:hypothetical protein